MTSRPAALPPARVVYPDSDDEPMAENTRQYNWIVKLKANLDACLPHDFVAGDLFWYPVEGDNRTRVAPDVMVALGRPKGDRGSYMQWEEANIPPRVVFEIWSPGNTFESKYAKVRFYSKFGVEEFYTWDTERNIFAAFIRKDGHLEPVATEGGFTSPLLGIRFVPGEDLEVFRPDGTPFLTTEEFESRAIEAKKERDAVAQERDAVAQERDAVAQERDAVAHVRDQALARAEALAAKLKALGVDPD